MKFIYCFLIMVLGTTAIFAGSAGTVSGLLLSEDIGARTMGLGGAFGAIADDVHAIRYNPAGLVQISQNEFSFTHVSSFIDIYYESLMLGIPLKNGKSAIGFDIDYLNYGNIEKRNEHNENEGNYSANESVFTFCFSTKVREQLMFGSNIKMWNGKIESEKANAFAADFGALFILNEFLNFGFSVQNMGSKIKYIETEEDMPLNVRLSTKYTPSMSYPPIISLDFNIPKGNKLSLNAGLELWVNEAIAVRVGYRDKVEEGKTSLGFCVRGYSFQLDYAYLFANELDGTHRISATFRFGGMKADSPYDKMKQRNAKFKTPKVKEKIDDSYKFNFKKSLDNKVILFPPPTLIK